MTSITEPTDEDVLGMTPHPLGNGTSSSARGIDETKIINAVSQLLDGLGLDTTSPGLRDTPSRYARMCREIFGGLHQDPRDVLGVAFPEGYTEPVIVRDISFTSICEHHLVPFLGHAHIGYHPGPAGEVVGLSKLARLVDVVSRRPTLQERITATVTDTLEAVLAPKGVACVIEAEHFCMTMRGVRKPGSRTVTTAFRGMFATDESARSTMLSMMDIRR